MQYYDIIPDKIFAGNEKVVLVTGGEEKYQFAESFSSKLIVPDTKYCPPKLATGKISDSAMADIYNFSILCYYIITSTADSETKLRNKKEKIFQKNRLMNAVKKHNIPFTLSKSIMAENPKERNKKVPHIKIIAGTLAFFFLFSAIFYFLINNGKAETESGTPSPATTENPFHILCTDRKPYACTITNTNSGSKYKPNCHAHSNTYGKNKSY